MPEVSKISTLSQPALTAASHALPTSDQPLDDEYLQSLPIQAKYLIGAPDDPLEKEADQMANQVTALPETSFLQRKCAECEEEEKLQRKPLAPFIQKKEALSPGFPANGLSDSIEATKGMGSVMNPSAKSFMESRFGRDFSDVKIHTDPYAVQLSRDLHAQAFTTGKDIYFNSGKYAPGSNEGKHLLAHELSHVVQQQGSATATAQKKDETSDVTADTTPQTDKSLYQLIPTARLNITLDFVYFNVSADAHFQPGPKRYQVIGIILKTLLGDQFSEDLIGPVEKALLANAGIKLVGHMKDKREAYAGEPINQIFLSIGSFLDIISFLNQKKLTVQLSSDEKNQLTLLYYNELLWARIGEIAKNEGYAIPAWYDRYLFNQQMAGYTGLLKEYATLSMGAANSEEETTGKVSQIFDLIYEEIIILESIRKDSLLGINPSTQLAYRTIWQQDEKASPTKPPSLLRSMPAAMMVIQIARKNEELGRDTETQEKARIKILELFTESYDFQKEELKILPPFPSFIVAPDLNPDYSTVTTASNLFRMITAFNLIHGDNTLHGVTVAMKMNLYHSWKVFKMPESLKKLKDGGVPPQDMTQLTDDFVKNSPQNLGEPVDTYSPKKDREQKVSMDKLGLGDFVLMGLAVPTYTKDMNWVQKPSTAGFSFSVFNVADLARTSVYGNIDALEQFKKQPAPTDPKEKEAWDKALAQLEKRESQNLLSLTQGDINDTEKLLKATEDLKNFMIKDANEKNPYYGNKDTDPFFIRLRKQDPDLFDLYRLIRQSFPFNKYGDLQAVEEYNKVLVKQKDDLTKLRTRSYAAYGSFLEGAPTYRVIGGIVKKEDGNLVPLLMVVGYHPDADPINGKYKIKLVDVTFDAPNRENMIYVGESVESSDRKTGERDAITSAFDKFAGKHHYGKGKIVYRIPGTDFSGELDSYTPLIDYLEYAVAAIGLVVLVAGIIIFTAGAGTPVALEIAGAAVALAGAYLSYRHIEERKEKGTFEWDAATALDILNIIAGLEVGVGIGLKVALKASQSVSLLLSIERAGRLLIIYRGVNVAANAFLLHEKVKEDIDRIKKLKLPKNEEEELISQVYFEAVQQGAILAVSAYQLGRGAFEHYKAQVEGVSYHTWQERGWIEEVNGKLRITEQAPPFLRAKMTLFGKLPTEGKTIPEDIETGKGTEPETTTPKTPEDIGGTEGKKPEPTAVEETKKTQTPAAGEGTKTVPDQPLPFEERIPARWKTGSKDRPPRLDNCVAKLRKLNLSEDNILAIINNAANVKDPNLFFGDFNTFLSNAEKNVGKNGLNILLEGLANKNTFQPANLLVRGVSYNQNVKGILDVLSLDDIAGLRGRYPDYTDTDFINNLKTMVDRIEGSKAEIFDLLDRAGKGADGMEKLNSALGQLGEGRFTPQKVIEALDFEVRLQEAFAKGGPAVAETVFENKTAGRDEQGRLKVAESLGGKKPGDQASEFIRKRLDKIVSKILGEGQKDIDMIKWGVFRETIENTDLPTIVKNDIIGEVWAATKVQQYKNQGFEVVREVHIELLNADGSGSGEYAKLDAVLIKGDELHYKEFKSSETAEVSKNQEQVYDRLNKGDIKGLRPFGDRAAQAFGGKGMPRFRAGSVEIDRPAGL